MSQELELIQNSLSPYAAGNYKKAAGQIGITDGGGSDKTNRNLQNVVFPSQLQRARKDLSDWLAAIEETEHPWIPYRVLIQRLYEITKLNEHLAACMERRNDLTLLRKFEMQNPDGSENKDWTKYFRKAWFTQKVLPYTLDAQYYGYNLISIGDFKTDEDTGIPMPVFPTIIQRRFISPDRKMVSPWEYNFGGYNFTDPKYAKWHIWVPTVSTNGISSCGLGLLYPVAKTEIYLRNNVAFNMSFIQMFAAPYRSIKSAKTEGPERDKLEAAAEAMGDAGYIILDLMDEIEFLNDGAAGNGYKSYNDFEHRLEAKISKYILGHADAIDSVPSKMGTNQLSTTGGKTDMTSAATPVAKALRDKQSKDGEFCEPIINEQVIPCLRNILADYGIDMPLGLKFVFLNDAEEREIQNEEAMKNQTIATLALTMAQGGLKMPASTFKAMTGIDCVDVAIEPDNNVTKDKKEQAAGKGPLKDDSKKRTNKPKKT